MAQDKFPINSAQIVGLFMESVFYGKPDITMLQRSCLPQLTKLDLGIFLVSFFDCMRALLWSGGWFKPIHLLNVKMLVASVLMFTLASLDVAFHLRHNLEAFIWFNGNPIDDFEKTSAWLNVIAMGCYVAQTFVGDSILIFRCWVVYNKSWSVIAIPSLLWIGTCVCGVITIYVEATINTSGKLLNASTLVPFITTMLCLTLATNILTTSAIVYRIWTVRRGLVRPGATILTLTSGSPLTSIAIVLIESGLLYTMSIVILFGLYLASNNAQYGVSNAVVQIIGITFNLIITSVDRREQGSQGMMRRYGDDKTYPVLHMINVQTTISHFSDTACRDHISPPESLEPTASVKVDNNDDGWDAVGAKE